MLPKSKRLSTKAFKEVIEKGQSFHSPFLIARILPTDGKIRFSISVPKKVAKLANDRNRIRRRIYSIIDKFISRIDSNCSVVLIVKVGIEKVKFTNLSEEVEKIFVKSLLIK